MNLNDVYLDNSILSTNGTYSLNSYYTILFAFKSKNPISSNKWLFNVGFGSMQTYIGGAAKGVQVRVGDVGMYTGAGDNYSRHVALTNDQLNRYNYHVYSISWDGSQAALYIDGVQQATSTAARNIGGNFYVGGFPNSGSTLSNGIGYVDYASGYYKNIVIFDRALSGIEQRDAANYFIN